MLRHHSTGSEVLPLQWLALSSSRIYLLQLAFTLKHSSGQFIMPINLIAIIVFSLLLLCRLQLHIIPAYCAATTDTISAGQGLAGNQRLISSNGKFALSFFRRPSSKSSSHNASSNSNWYLGIWFNQITKCTPAWVANGDKPVADSASPELTVSGDGNLVILDRATKSIIWSTQANFATTGTANNTTTTVVAMLLKTGNLVLQQHNTSDSSVHVLWQSFDYPTDTHLPGAKLGRDKVTGLNRRLVSRKNSIDPAPGIYSYELHETEAYARFSLAAWFDSSSMAYWFSGEWNGHYFGSIPEMTGHQWTNSTFVNNPQEMYFTYTLLDDATIMRFALDVSGQAHIFLWVESAQNWVATYTNPKNQCDVYGISGPFTTCQEDRLPFCSCMEGFSISSPDDWELGDRTGGCMRNTLFLLECSTNKSTSLQDKFCPMPCVSLLNNGRKIGDATSSADGCAQVCLGNCTCTAYSYGNNGCFVWEDELTNVKQQQCNDIGQATLCLPLAPKEVQTSQKNRDRKINALVIVSASALSFGLLSLFLLLIIRSRYAHRMKNLQGVSQIVSQLELFDVVTMV